MNTRKKKLVTFAGAAAMLVCLYFVFQNSTTNFIPKKAEAFEPKAADKRSEQQTKPAYGVFAPSALGQDKTSAKLAAKEIEESEAKDLFRTAHRALYGHGRPGKESGYKKVLLSHDYIWDRVTDIEFISLENSDGFVMTRLRAQTKNPKTGKIFDQTTLVNVDGRWTIRNGAATLDISGLSNSALNAYGNLSATTPREPVSPTFLGLQTTYLGKPVFVVQQVIPDSIIKQQQEMSGDMYQAIMPAINTERNTSAPASHPKAGKNIVQVWEYWIDAQTDEILIERHYNPQGDMLRENKVVEISTDAHLRPEDFQLPPGTSIKASRG